jgi:hypothetical protein
MSKHDYLVLGMAAVFIVTNFLGAAFTIRHVDRHERGPNRWKSPAS